MTDLLQPYLETLLVWAVVQCACVMSHTVELLIWLGDVAERANLTKCHCSNLYNLSSVLGEINQALRNG